MTLSCDRNLKVIIQQPALPAYRVPVFREFGKRSGLSVSVLYSTVAGFPNAPAEGFEATRCSTRNLPFGLSWENGQMLAAASSADVIVLSWNVRALSLPIALKLARRKGIGTVLWGHGYSKHESMLRQAFRRRVADLADAVVFYGPSEAARFTRDRGRPERVFVAFNSLEQTSIAALREHWQSSPGALAAFMASAHLFGPTIVFVSRLEPANQVNLLLQAMNVLRQQIPNVTLIIVGDGSDRRTLEAEAARLSLQDSVRFLGAMYQEEVLAPWMMAADVFCYPNNMGLSVLHAFGYGLPVVAGDDSGSHNPEVDALRDGVNGLLFPSGSASGLAAALARLLTDAGLRQRMRHECLRTVREQFTIERMIDGLEAAVRYAGMRRDVRMKFTSGGLNEQ